MTKTVILAAIFVALHVRVGHPDLVSDSGHVIAADYATGVIVPTGQSFRGYGTLVTSNDPNRPIYVDGSLSGLGPNNPVVLEGFVKGSGSFDHAVFDGTYSPGHSPTHSTVGSVIYTASNVLIMELGGLIPGTQHDKITHTGLSQAGGTLDVVLINGFVPSLGHVFDIFDWNAGVLGAFSPVNLPSLAAGLAWDTSDLYASGNLYVTAIPETGSVLLVGGALLICLLAQCCTRWWPDVRWTTLSSLVTYTCSKRAETYNRLTTTRPWKWFLSAFVLICGAYDRGNAVTHVWTGTNTSMNMSSSWNTNTIPISGDPGLTLIFPLQGGNLGVNQDIANPLVVETLFFGPQSYTFTGGNSMRLQNLGVNPSIDFGDSFGNVFQDSIDFAAPTLITGGNNTGHSFHGQLSGNNVVWSGYAPHQIQYILGNGAGSANSLGGNQVIQGGAYVSANKGAGVAAIGGNIQVTGVSTNNSASTLGAGNTPNQFAAGTNIEVDNLGILDIGNANQTLNDLTVNSNGSVRFSGFGNPTLLVQGTISSSSGAGLIVATYGGNKLIDFDGQLKTVDVTSTGAGDGLNIAVSIVNGRINKTGAGRLTLSSNFPNSFTGTNIVNAGTLSGTASAIGDVTNNATVELTGSSNTLTTNQISGPGQVVIKGSTTYQVPQGYTGGTILNAPLTGDSTTLLGPLSGSGNLHFSQTANGAFSGSISGAVSVTKSGAGTLSVGGNNPYTGATAVNGGVLDVQSDTAIGTGTLFVSFAGLQATGSRTLTNPLALTGAVFEGTGDFTFTDSSSKTVNSPVTHNSTGSTTIAGKWQQFGSPITVNAGQLSLGDPAVVQGFTTLGPVIVNGGTLTLNSLNFITLPTVALAGGTLNAPNGYALPLGAALQGNGGVTGRVASANGSSIIADGNLTIGDTAHVAGVNLDGELYTDVHTITLQDANQSVLGSVTHLGDGTNGGVINAPNGLVVNFGRNMTGRGQINSTNNLSQAVIMNGAVQGDSIINYIEFTGYVKGVGTFNNVAFSGTFAPGLSPAVVELQRAVLTGTNVLDMEIGGLTRGGQYDAIDISELLTLDGTLKLTLWDGFQPQLGDSWQLFDGPTTGEFRQFDLPALESGITWDLRLLSQTGILSVRTRAIGDFNLDGILGIADVDQLVSAISSGTGNLDFDVDGDGTLNQADLGEWLWLAGRENLPSGMAYMVGDANLDGLVDGLDFIRWNNHKFTAVAAWSAGDFNADGVVDGIDFIEWNSHRFSSNAVSLVPESGITLWWMMLVFSRNFRLARTSGDARFRRVRLAHRALRPAKTNAKLLEDLRRLAESGLKGFNGKHRQAFDQ